MDSKFFSKVEDNDETPALDDDTIRKIKSLIKQHPELIKKLFNTN